VVGVAALLGYWLLVIALQHWRGAPAASFDGYPDEPSHYISGLMVREYLTSGLSRTPTAFAQDYYLHVPYFAVGYWPPLFYIAEAFWMLLFGPGRAATLLLIALIAAFSATLIFLVLRSSIGAVAAFGLGVVFLLLPIVVSGSLLVMTDLAVTVLSFGALIALASYLESERITPLLIFTILTALTILTKGSGLYLLGVLPAALIVTGRWRWFLRWSFWLAPLGVALLCAPWYIISQNFLTRGFLARTEFITALRVLGWDTVRDLGLLAPLVVWGVWTCMRARPIPALAAICMLQPLVLAAFLMTAPVIVEPRYMSPALPPLVVLAGYGIYSIAKSSRRERTVGLAVTGLLVITAAFRIYAGAPVQVKNTVRPVAEFVVGHTQPPYRSAMVSADAEGPMIAEIAQIEPRSTARYLVRPGKVLARMDWLGRNYEQLHASAEQMQTLFDRMPVDVVILRSNPGPGALPHERMLAETIHASPARWRRVYPPAGQSSRYEAYEPVRTEPAEPGALEQFLRHEMALPGTAALLEKSDRSTP